MTRDELIEAMARAATKAASTRHYGLYDYSRYPGDAPPHVVIEEKTGRVAFGSDDSKIATAEYERLTRQAVGDSTLDAICAALPGLSDVIDGKAVIVPVEPTDEMNCEGSFVIFSWREILDESALAGKVYGAMIEARPK